MLVDPTGLFSGLATPEDACALCLLKFSTFLGDQHLHAQCLGLPQLWHLPLCLLHPLALSEWMAVRALSVCPFLPSFLWFWWCICVKLLRGLRVRLEHFTGNGDRLEVVQDASS
jgi:hypothetical protein